MIKHIVCWRIRENENKVGIATEIQAKLLALKNVISDIQFIEVGINSEMAQAGNHDVVLVTEFASFKGLNNYVSHPAHVEAATFIKENTTDRVAVDYEF